MESELTRDVPAAVPSASIFACPSMSREFSRMTGVVKVALGPTIVAPPAIILSRVEDASKSFVPGPVKFAVPVTGPRKTAVDAVETRNSLPLAQARAS